MCITVKIAEDPCAERLNYYWLTRMSHLKAKTYSTQVHELRDLSTRDAIAVITVSSSSIDSFLFSGPLLLCFAAQFSSNEFNF